MLLFLKIVHAVTIIPVGLAPETCSMIVIFVQLYICSINFTSQFMHVYCGGLTRQVVHCMHVTVSRFLEADITASLSNTQV